MARPPSPNPHLGVVGEIGGRRVDGVGGSIGHFLGRSLGVFQAHALAVVGIGGLAVATGFVVAIFVLALLAFVFLGLTGAILAHIERVEQIVHHVAEPALVGEHALEPVEIAAGALLDQRPPQIDELARGRRGRLASEPLAHQHGDRILDRGIGAVADFVVFAPMETVVEHSGEILLHAAHAARADGLDARLLDGFEHRARLLAAGHELAMHRRIVTGEAERDGIRVAAHDCGLALVEPPRRFRQPHLVGGKPGTFGGERHFDVALAGDGAHAHGNRALERLGRGFLGGSLRLDVRRHRSAPAPFRRGHR